MLAVIYEFINEATAFLDLEPPCCPFLPCPILHIHDTPGIFWLSPHHDGGFIHNMSLQNMSTVALVSTSIPPHSAKELAEWFAT